MEFLNTIGGYALGIIGAGLAGCEAAWQLANAGIKVELHVFPRGGHGVALPTLECFTEEELKNVNINKELTVWFDLCLNWLKNLGF